MAKICGVCGKEINWENRWEIVNHYGKDTIYGKQGVIKTIYTFCSERCMLDWINRGTVLSDKKIVNPNIIGKTILKGKSK